MSIETLNGLGMIVFILCGAMLGGSLGYTLGLRHSEREVRELASRIDREYVLTPRRAPKEG